MRTETTELRSVYRYIDLLYAKEDALLLEIRQKAKELSKEGICLHAHEARFLQVLIRALKIQSIVEIGTFVGYSAVWLARALPQNGRLITLEKEIQYQEIAQNFFSRSDLENKIQSLYGEASDLLISLQSQAPFDMVFIDANKVAYWDYLLWAEKNLKSGGLLVADNTLLFGKVISDVPPENTSKNQWQKMRDFNQRIANTDLFEGVLLPTAEGLTVAIKK